MCYTKACEDDFGVVDTDLGGRNRDYFQFYFIWFVNMGIPAQDNIKRISLK